MSIFAKKEEKGVYDQFKAKFDAYNTALATSQEALHVAQARYDEAKADMEIAADEDDPAAFAVAKASLAEAETAIEMAKMRLERLMAKGAVSKEEAAAACSHYKQKLRAIDVNAAKKITRHVDEIIEIEKAAYAESCSAAKEYAELLKLLDRQEEINAKNGSPSQVHSILSKDINILQDIGGWPGSNKSRLYALAKSGK